MGKIKIGFWHTLALQQRFYNDLLDNHLPDRFELIHFVNDKILEKAKDVPVDQLSKELAQDLTFFKEHKTDLLIGTCSTFGEVFEREASQFHPNALRVDRPMMEEASSYNQVIIMAALASTLKPSSDLFENITGSPAISHLLPLEVFDSFKKGNTNLYGKLIANHISTLPKKATIILAQSSMAVAKEYIPDDRAILDSPSCLISKLATYLKS